MVEKPEADNINDDVSLEEMDVSFDDVQDDDDDTGTSDESSEQEDNAESESEPDKEDAEDEVEEDESEEESEPEAKADEPDEPEDTQLSDEEKRKQHNREMAEKRIQDKKLREQEILKQQKEYISEAEDDKDLALRQLQVDAYNNKIETNTNKLTNSFERAMNDFTIFKDPNPEIQAELDQALDTFQALYVTIDQYGNPADVRSDLYSYLKTKADSIQRLTQIGAKKESNAKTKSKANALVPPSRTPKEPKKDEAFDAFDEEANRW